MKQNRGRAWALWLGAIILDCGFGCGAAGYREARLTQPAELITRGFTVEVSRVYLNEETVMDGVADGTALVVELEITNHGRAPYQLSPGQVWCQLAIDTRHPEQTRLLPPSVSGDGPFPGLVPEAAELAAVDVAPGQTRTAWVLFRGYRFEDSDIPRRVTLTFPDPEGRPVELVLADSARGLPAVDGPGDAQHLHVRRAEQRDLRRLCAAADGVDASLPPGANPPLPVGHRPRVDHRRPGQG